MGGTTGVGKSTLATQIAHRLGITRVVSTDTVRQVMRAFFAPDLMPEIQYSSFEAAAGVRIPLPDWSDADEAGFIEQAKSIAVGVNAVVDRAITEGQRTIIEGVHIVPGFLDRSRWNQAVVVEVVLAIRDAERHRSHFYVREWETDGIRPLRRYIQSFAKISKIQDYILAQAAKQGVTVLENDSIDQTVKAVMAGVLDAVAEYPQPAADPKRRMMEPFVDTVSTRDPSHHSSRARRCRYRYHPIPGAPSDGRASNDDPDRQKGARAWASHRGSPRFSAAD